MARKKVNEDNNDKELNKKQDKQQQDIDCAAYGMSYIHNIGDKTSIILDASKLGSLGPNIIENKPAYFASGILLEPNKIDVSKFYGATLIEPNLVLQSTKIEQDLEEEISQLKKENRVLVDDLTEKRRAVSEHTQEIDELKGKLNQLRSTLRDKERLQNLFHKVHPIAWEKLEKDEEFRELFQQKKSCSSIVVSIDIRRSTELMLRAKDAESYQNFIIILCVKLRQIILDNYGVFDKFTGDGILAFFPYFYSGDDAIYLALKSAQECHNYFNAHYHKNRSCFNTILSDVGLGIGIDYGNVNLVNIHDWLTVIGRPVVHACRLSAAPAGTTLLNQQAYDLASDKFGRYVNFQDFPLKTKHEGVIIAYSATLSDKNPEIKKPAWYEVEAN